MAEDPKPENQNPQGTPPSENVAGGGKAVPKSTDIVSDNHAKSIRTLEEKLSASEKTTQDLRAELKDLEAIVKKAGEVKTPVITETPQTVLGFLEGLIFKK
jgi:hypothetical protein